MHSARCFPSPYDKGVPVGVDPRLKNRKKLPPTCPRSELPTPPNSATEPTINLSVKRSAPAPSEAESKAGLVVVKKPRSEPAPSILLRPLKIAPLKTDKKINTQTYAFTPASNVFTKGSAVKVEGGRVAAGPATMSPTKVESPVPFGITSTREVLKAQLAGARVRMDKLECDLKEKEEENEKLKGTVQKLTAELEAAQSGSRSATPINESTRRKHDNMRMGALKGEVRNRDSKIVHQKHQINGLLASCASLKAQLLRAGIDHTNEAGWKDATPSESQKSNRSCSQSQNASTCSTPINQPTHPDTRWQDTLGDHLHATNFNATPAATSTRTDHVNAKRGAETNWSETSSNYGSHGTSYTSRPVTPSRSTSIGIVGLGGATHPDARLQNAWGGHILATNANATPITTRNVNGTCQSHMNWSETTSNYNPRGISYTSRPVTPSQSFSTGGVGVGNVGGRQPHSLPYDPRSQWERDMDRVKEHIAPSHDY